MAAFTGYLTPASAADRVSVTIVWGDKDRLLLPRQLERARRRLPRARHVLINEVGHLMMVDDPQAVADVIRSGVRTPAPDAAPIAAPRCAIAARRYAIAHKGRLPTQMLVLVVAVLFAIRSARPALTRPVLVGAGAGAGTLPR